MSYEVRRRKRRSAIWKMPAKDFAELVRTSTTVADIVRSFGYKAAGGIHKVVWKRINEDGIDAAHLPRGKGANSGTRHRGGVPSRPLSEVMIENSTYSRRHLRKRLIEGGLLENKCALCGQLPEWEGKPLILILDHINGINNDSRFENLRLICRHCDSQLPTFAGRNNKKSKASDWTCRECGVSISRTATFCRKHVPSRRKVVRPEIAVLLREIETLGYEGTGRKYGVSGSAIRKWC